MSKKFTRIAVDPAFKRKMIEEAKLKRGITVMEYTRLLAASDKDMKQLINSDVKLEKKPIKKRGYSFGF